jgi:hypothetical protein
MVAVGIFEPRKNGTEYVYRTVHLPYRTSGFLSVQDRAGWLNITVTGLINP